MKKVTTILFASVTFFASTQLISCKKKDDKKEATIIGSWASKTIYASEKLNGVKVYDTTLPYPSFEATFNSNNTYSMKNAFDPTENETGSFSTNGSKLITTNSAGEKDTVDYEVSTSELIIKGVDAYTDADGNHSDEFRLTFTKK